MEGLANSLSGIVAGTINEIEAERMKKLLFRVTRGMAVTYFQPYMQDGVAKCVYVVIFNNHPNDRQRVTKVCESFMGLRIEVPQLGELEGLIKDTERSILDSERMLKISKRQLKEYLYSLNYNKDKKDGSDNEVSTLEVQKWLVAKEKAIYNALNMMKSRKATYIGFLWAPYEMQTMINEGLRDFQTTEFSCYRNDPDEPHQLNPPTYFKLNDVTWFFQEFVNTYGVPSYMEANPAPFCIVTFPFMFGIMFGDYGHGSLIFFAGLCLTLGADKLKGSSPFLDGILKCRYVLLLMGMFAMYNGMLYNEFFAIPNDWFGSCYNMTMRNTTANNTGSTDNPSANFVYPPNLDPPNSFGWVN